jgi:hypothetical protein
MKRVRLELSLTEKNIQGSVTRHTLNSRGKRSSEPLDTVLGHVQSLTIESVF